MTTYLSKDSLGCDCHYYWFLLQCSVIFQHKSLPPPKLKKKGLVCLCAAPARGCPSSVRLPKLHVLLLLPAALTSCLPPVVWRVVGQPRRQQVGVSLRPAGEQVTLSLTVSVARVHGVCLQRTRACMALCFFFFSFREMDTN